jgi:hypothetical protein
MHGYWYLASPYSHPDPIKRQERFEEAERALFWLWQRGEIVYSPIVHWHPTATKFGLPFDYETFKGANKEMLRHSSGLLVLELKGWEESKGIEDELKMASWLSIPRKRLIPAGLSYRMIAES